MRKGIFLMAAFCLCLLVACNNNEEPTVVEPAVPSAPQTLPDLPPYPEDKLMELYTKTDHIDFLFMQNSFSINVAGEGAQNQVRMIRPEAVTRYPCGEVVKMFIQSQGEELAHAGVFFDGANCSHVIIYVNDRPAYANALDPGGIGFFQNIMTRFSTQPGPPQ